MAVTYAYTDTTGRKLTQSAYDAQVKAGTDVSKYTKITPTVATSTTTVTPTPTPTPTTTPVQPTPTVDPMAKIKELPQYQDLLNKGYTEEQISKAVEQYKPKKESETAVVSQSEVETATPVQPAEQTTTTQAKPEDLEATTAGKDQQVLAPLPLSEYKDDSEARQSQIVNNLNAYRQSSPAYMKDLDTFRKTFSYGLRSDTQRTLLDNWYLGYQKGLELNSKNASDLSSLYANGNITDSDLEQLRLQNPNKYAEVMALNDKNSTLAKYDAELNGKETSTNPFQSIINNYASNMLSMSTAPSNMFAEYKAAMNSEEMKGMQSQLTDKEGEINQLDLQINQIKSDVERRYEGTGATKTKINAIIADETSALQELRNSKAIDYQTLAKKYENQMTSITDSFNMQIKEQEYNNAQRNQQMQELGFMMELQNYETNEQADERERNKFIRQQEYQDGNIYSSDPATRRKAIEKSVDRVLAEFEGIPMIRSREQMIADIQKMVDNGTELGEAITQNIRKPIMNKPEYTLWKKNKLGIDTTPIDIGGQYYTQNADGSLSLWKGYGTTTTINGKTFAAVDPTLVSNSIKSLTSTLTSNPLREKKAQCGEGVNDWLNTLGIQGNVFGDPINVKETVINSNTAKVGSVVVFDPTGSSWGESQKAKYGFVAGHVAIVTDVDGNGNPTRIAHWNKDGTKTYAEEALPSGWNKYISGYFDPTLGGSSSVSGGATNAGSLTERANILKSGMSKQARDSFNEALNATGGDTNLMENIIKDMEIDKYYDRIKDPLNDYQKAEAPLQEINNAFSRIDAVWQSYKANPKSITSKNALDQVLVIGLNKILDPGSVVRESEFARAPEGMSFFNKREGKISKIQEGGVGLTDKERNEIINAVTLMKKGQLLAVNTYKNDLLLAGKTLNVPEQFIYGMIGGKEKFIVDEQSNTTTSNAGTTKNYFATYRTVTPTNTTSTSYSSSPYFNYISGY